MLSLKLFNAVIDDGSNEVIVNTQYGYVAKLGAKSYESKINKWFKDSHLSGNQLNSTFYKSWQQVRNSTQEEIYLEHVKHYATTYGNNFQGNEFYLPEGFATLPVKSHPKFVLINAVTKEELISMATNMLTSGVALKQDTILDLLSLLAELNVDLSTLDIKNKEALMYVCDATKVLPSSPEEILRYIVFKATTKTLLIKNKEVISLLKSNVFDLSVLSAYNIVQLSEIFNRYKPLFLALKVGKNIPIVNRIAKLSKKHHKPLAKNILSYVTSELINNSNKHWLKNATPFALLKAMQAIHLRINGQTHYSYNIRNGKAWTELSEVHKPVNSALLESNMQAIVKELKLRVKSDCVVYMPPEVEYGLPTSEKLFVGNVPFGTKITAHKIAAGIYWDEESGASDIDLSTISLSGMVSWCSAYYNNDKSVVYSGDMTYPPATEYMYMDKNVKPSLLCANVYNGSPKSNYDIIVGTGNKITKQYMMDPGKVMFTGKVQSACKFSVIGYVQPEDNGLSVTLLNIGIGSSNVGTLSDKTVAFINSLKDQWTNPLTLKKVLDMLNITLTDQKNVATIDLTLASVTKQKFLDIFS